MELRAHRPHYCSLYVTHICLPCLFLQTSMSVRRRRRFVEPIRSVEIRSGHTRVITSSPAVPVTSLATTAAAVKVILGFYHRQMRLW